MGVSYNKLFKLMIDKQIRKGELCKAAGISGGVLLKMSKNGNVNVDVLSKVCRVLQCDFGDIMEYVPEDNETIVKEINDR